jgi:hypothetical protein
MLKAVSFFPKLPAVVAFLTSEKAHLRRSMALRTEIKTHLNKSYPPQSKSIFMRGCV